MAKATHSTKSDQIDTYFTLSHFFYSSSLFLTVASHDSMIGRRYIQRVGLVCVRWIDWHEGEEDQREGLTMSHRGKVLADPLV